MSRVTPSQPQGGDGLKLAFIAVLTLTVVVIVGSIISEAPHRDSAIFGIAYVLFGLSGLGIALYLFLEKRTALLLWLSRQIRKVQLKRR